MSHANQRPARGTGTVVAQPDTGIAAHAEQADISVVPGDVLDSDADPTDPLDGANPGDGTATAGVVVSGPAGTETSSAPGASLSTSRAAAALQDPPDRYRHGPELSWLLLQGRRDLQPDGVLVRTTPDDPRVPSRDLDNAASNPVLRDAVGLGGAGGGR